LRAEPGARPERHVRDRRGRHAQRAPRGVGSRHRTGAGHVVRHRLRRVPGQPDPDHRGLAGARRARLRVRARQDRDRPAVPAGDGMMTWGECADLIGMPRRRAPLGLFRRFGALMWKLHMAETPPGNLHFIVHPWIVSADKLKETTGWSPRYSSRETFEIAMRT